MLIGGEPYGSGVLGSEFDEESGETVVILEFICPVTQEITFYG